MRNQVTVDFNDADVARSRNEQARQRTFAGTNFEDAVIARIGESLDDLFEHYIAFEKMLAKAAPRPMPHDATSSSASRTAALKLPISTPPRPARSSAVP